MRRLSLLHAVTTGVAILAAGYLLGVPLLRARAQRGDYLFGHYALFEIYVGVPALAIAVVGVGLVLVPAARRGPAFARAAVATGTALAALFGFDAAYALVLRGAIVPHVWLDYGHISRADNLPDDELGFRRRPNTTWTGVVPETRRTITYRVDERGFRNPPGVEHAEIAFVGDSYTEAAQIDEPRTFVQLVGARTGKSVVNLGRGAYGPQQERIVLERDALACKPKLVVWQLFDGNDLGDAIEFAAWKRGDVKPAPLGQRYLDNSLFRPLLESTFESKRGDFVRLVDDHGDEVPTTLRYRWMPRQVVERAAGFEATVAALQEGVAACRAQGVDVLIVFVPVMARVFRDRLRFVDPADRERYTPEDPTPLQDFGTGVAYVAADLEVPFLDLYPRFRAAAEREIDGLYILRDEHLDRRGHQVVADAIVEWLASRH